MSNTESQYQEIIDNCFDLFSKKNKDYGASWMILRLPSITDQIFIKAQRIRTIQENGFSKINEGIIDEFKGIINYCIMAVILIDFGTKEDKDLDTKYKNVSNDIKELLFNKNHDYGEAWRNMRISSMTDIILMKLMRIKQIEDNKGQTLVSEGIKAGYQDIVNYSVFCLIKSNEAQAQIQQQQ